MATLIEEECAICRSQFSIESEGGITGCIGMIPVAFCPTCLTGIVEMVDELDYHCWRYYDEEE